MRVRIAITVCVLLSWSIPVYAQGVGAESPFAFGFGSRDLALGGASIARSDFTTAPFWNASRLAEAQHTQMSLFHSRLFDSDVGYQYVGIVVPTLDIGSFGLGIARLGVGGIEKRDASNVVLGEVSDSRLGLFFAYGRPLAGYDVGVTVSFEHHSLDGYSATSSPGLDFSLSREFHVQSSWIRRATLTLRGGNVVPPETDLAVQAVQYPLVMSGAGSIDFSFDAEQKHAVSLMARIDKADRDGARSAFGLEYEIGPTLQFRGGLREGKLSAGAGIKYRVMQFDYSVVGRDLGSIHMVTLTTSLGRSMDERRAQRDLDRERDFTDLMNLRLREQNVRLVETLTAEGDSVQALGRTRDALSLYDRALFLARSHVVDTLAISAKASAAQKALTHSMREDRYRRYVDSAAATFERGEFVSASYYANLAKQEMPSGAEADDWSIRAEQALTERENREELISRTLAAIDSLLGVGSVDQAVLSADALLQYAPHNSNVQLSVNRAHFESYRTRATDARAAGSTHDARAWLDSARAVYPKHRWCEEFERAIRPSRAAAKAPSQPVPAKAPPKPSADMIREARVHYEAGQDAFREGNLPAAIAEWELVERIVPEFESIRSYLVKAYRLTGIDYYGRNLLEDAVATWKRAYELDQDNDEIKGFIDRTEAEIRRLGELSYEQF